MILVFNTFGVVCLKIYRKIRYPHHFRFENQKKYTEQHNWILENIKGKWSRWLDYDEFFDLKNGYTFGFNNKKDAMAFKLRWC